MEDEKQRLKDTVRRIVVGQGNRFIKELLRDKNLTIGTTKADFAANLMGAIDDETLSPADVESWLAEVEGWGNQHLYLYPGIKRTRADIEARVQASTHAGLFGRQATYDFPDKLSLTTIALTDTEFTVSWHQGNDRWARLKMKDFRREEAGDTIEYRAHLRRSRRTVVRYEWRFDRPYAAVFVQLPMEGALHKDSLDAVWNLLLELGLFDARQDRLALTRSVNALAEDRARVTASGRTMRAEGGYVDFVSTIPDRGIADIAALRTVDQGIDSADFQSADGRFRLDEGLHAELSRAVHLEVYGGERRLKIGVQCHRDDVYYLTDLIWDMGLP